MAKTQKNDKSGFAAAFPKVKSKKSTKKTSKGMAPHIIVKALAGTGKTTTLIGALHHLNGAKQKIVPSEQQLAIWEAIAAEKPASICFVAFNKSIANELQSRVPAGVMASTIHSLGRSVLVAHPQIKFACYKPNAWKTTNILERMLGMDWRELNRKGIPVNNIKELVGLCKLNLVDPFVSPEEFKMQLDQVATHHDIPVFSPKIDVPQTVQNALLASLEMDGKKGSRTWMTEIDFDDMVWIPVVLNLVEPQFDLMLVDESQDLNKCQQELVRRSGRRLVFVGDEHQAIYGFAGSDSDSIASLERELGNTDRKVQVLDLTMTRRCGHKIVEVAKQIVPKFEAHESNCEGSVRDIEDTELLKNVRDADMVVCRTNAPLVSTCFRLLKSGRKARIQGRSIGEGLIKLVDSFKADTIEGFVAALDQWHAKERDKLEAKKFPPEAALIALDDKYDCLTTFSENCQSVDDVKATINRIFSDEGLGVLLSSIHRAKGLEAKTVFVLRPDLLPHPMSKLPWQVEQEMNLKYVAYTRAIENLVIVNPTDKEEL